MRRGVATYANDGHRRSVRLGGLVSDSTSCVAAGESFASGVAVGALPPCIVRVPLVERHFLKAADAASRCRARRRGAFWVWCLAQGCEAGGAAFVFALMAFLVMNDVEFTAFGTGVAVQVVFGFGLGKGTAF